MLTILHNPRCGKSRQALQFLSDNSVPHRVRLYLIEPLDQHEWQTMLRLEGISWDVILRKKEAAYSLIKDLIPGQEAEAFDILAANPILMERPVVLDNNQALVARSIDDLHVWLKKYGYL